MKTAAANTTLLGMHRSPNSRLVAHERCVRPPGEPRHPPVLRVVGRYACRVIRVVLLAIIVNDEFEFYPSPVRPVTETMHRVAIIQYASRERGIPSV